MDIKRFTEKAQEALAAAQQRATRRGQQQVDVEHLLAGLLEQDQGLAPAILSKAGVNVEGLKRRVEQELERLPRVSGESGGGDQVYVTGRLNRLLTQAEEEARRLKDDYVSVEHLLLAMTEEGGVTGRLFKEFGVTRDRLMSALQEVRGHQRVTSPNPEATYQALERFGRDLTKLAEENKLDPVIGRDEEIRRVIQVLSRRTKNNPVLIGEPGVGKTAIVEGLALRIYRGDVPEGLKGKRIVALDMGALLPGPSTAASSRNGSRRSSRKFRSRRATSSCSSTSCTPSSALARPREPWTQATCSSPCWPAANCIASAPPRSMSTASTSRRTPPWSAASSRSSSISRLWRTPSPSCAVCATVTRSITRASPSRTVPWWRRRCCPIVTSPTDSCLTRPST
jgi:hypothetical protein